MTPAMGYLRSLLIAVVLTLAGIRLADGQELSAAHIAQKALTDRGFDIGAVDGIWGPRSVAAMSRLQRDLGSKVMGLPDAATMEAIASAARPQTQAPVEHSASAFADLPASAPMSL